MRGDLVEGKSKYVQAKNSNFKQYEQPQKPCIPTNWRYKGMGFITWETGKLTLLGRSWWKSGPPSGATPRNVVKGMIFLNKHLECGCQFWRPHFATANFEIIYLPKLRCENDTYVWWQYNLILLRWQTNHAWISFDMRKQTVKKM